MRVLFLNSTFPGRFRSLAQAFGSARDNTVLFLAESGQKLALGGVRRLRLAPPAPCESDDLAEKEIVGRLRRAARAGNALLGLRKGGFFPDIVCASASMGGSFYLRDIFPDAFYVGQGDWFYTPGESHCFFTKGKPRPAADFAPARVANLWEYNALGDCDLAVISSLWQREQYPEFLQEKLHVVHSGINPRFFSPVENQGEHEKELVSFLGPPHEPARGFQQFVECLPYLLAQRPNCLVLIAWLESASGGGRTRDSDAHEREGEEALQRIDRLNLPPEQRVRVHVLGSRSLKEYRELLRSSTAHVYLAAPHSLTTGLLEAMACGTLVVGSDTPPVREIIRDGVNGFLCGFWDAECMGRTVANALQNAPLLGQMRVAAQQTILREFDTEVQTRRLMSLILHSQEGKKRKKKCRNISEQLCSIRACRAPHDCLAVTKPPCK